MEVREGMSPTVLTVGPSHTLRAAAKAMAEKAVGAAVVIDPEQPGPGILTERDMLDSIGAGQSPDEEKVADHLSSNLTFAEPSWSLEYAAEAMVRGGFRHLIVVDGGDLVGRPLDARHRALLGHRRGHLVDAQGHRDGLLAVAEEDPETGELKRSQIERVREERKREDESIEEDEAETHGRRAERADYLREKLEERAEAEREGRRGLVLERQVRDVPADVADPANDAEEHHGHGDAEHDPVQHHAHQRDGGEGGDHHGQVGRPGQVDGLGGRGQPGPVGSLVGHQ